MRVYRLSGEYGDHQVTGDYCDLIKVRQYLLQLWSHMTYESDGRR